MWSEVENTGNHTVFGVDDWLFFGPELHHIGAGRFWGKHASTAARLAPVEYADPLPAIIDFRDQLRALNIELVIVPVPPKAMVYPDKLIPEFPGSLDRIPRMDGYHQEFMDILRGEGIHVIDLLPDFLRERFEKKGSLYCRDDTHWSGRGCVLAGEMIASEIRRIGIIEPVGTDELDSEWRRIRISGDLGRTVSAESRNESLYIRVVGRRAGQILSPIQPDRTSPVLLLGDSHNLIFQAGDDMHARGAGLADQLAFEFGIPVDLIAVRGSGATPARINLMRRARSSSDYLSGKKVVIWCFGAREFTESDGWQNVPLTS